MEENWVEEYVESTPFSLLADGLKEQAPAVCSVFVDLAGPSSETVARRVLLEELPALDLEPAVRAAVPEILGNFLEWLEDTGRVADGRSLARFVGALGPAYRERCSPKGGLRTPPMVKKTADIGRNDPCPCGSGRKFKKCCAP